MTPSFISLGVREADRGVRTEVASVWLGDLLFLTGGETARVVWKESDDVSDDSKNGRDKDEV